MKLIHIDELGPTSWKNGAGVTREIARREDERVLFWRMSLADVDRDGPFSLFPGAERLLTVVDGAGLRLRHAGGVLDARPGIPIRFSGELAVMCELVAGPVRDFNLIFDPVRARLSVIRLEPGEHSPAEGRPLALLPLGRPCEVAGRAVPPRSILMFDQDSSPKISIDKGGAALLTTIE